MTEETIKRRLFRAKRRAIECLKSVQYDVIPADNSSFCVVATRNQEVRLIRIAVDEITEDDIDLIKNWQHPGNCTKEIWCKKMGVACFEIKTINH